MAVPGPGGSLGSGIGCGSDWAVIGQRFFEPIGSDVAVMWQCSGRGWTNQRAGNNVRGAPLPPLPKHCKSAVSRWSDARGASETSDWPSGSVEAVWPMAVSGSVGSVATAVPAVVPRPPCGSVGSDWPLRVEANRQCLRQCGGSTWR
jgi:hypothetical protein